MASTRTRSQFSSHGMLIGLRESGLGFNPESAGIVEQLVHALFGNFPVEQFTHARLRFHQDHLQLLWRILSRMLQDGLVKFRLELQDRGLLRRESQVIERIAPRHVSWLTAR